MPSRKWQLPASQPLTMTASAPASKAFRMWRMSMRPVHRYLMMRTVAGYCIRAEPAISAAV